jgi:hypothetical protein
LRILPACCIAEPGVREWIQAQTEIEGLEL